MVSYIYDHTDWTRNSSVDVIRNFLSIALEGWTHIKADAPFNLFSARAKCLLKHVWALYGCIHPHSTGLKVSLSVRCPIVCKLNVSVRSVVFWPSKIRHQKERRDLSLVHGRTGSHQPSSPARTGRLIKSTLKKKKVIESFAFLWQIILIYLTTWIRIRIRLL